MLLWDVIFKYCLNCFCLYVHSQVNNQSIKQYDETSCIVFSWSNIRAVIVGQDHSLDTICRKALFVQLMCIAV